MNQTEALETRLNLTLLFISCRAGMHKIIQYLDTVSICNLYTCYAGKTSITMHHSKTPNSSQETSRIFIAKILACYYYLKQNMLKADRSFYYSIYEQDHFTRFQNQHFVSLVEHDNGFSELYLRRQILMEFVRQILRKAESEKIQETLVELLDDPSIPLGKLLRENIGAGCQSVFQFFLVGLDQEEPSIQSSQLETLDQFFQQRYDNFYAKQFLTFASKKKHLAEQMKVRIVRFSSQEISYQNYKNYVLPENEIHNFIISLFLLADQHLTASQKYIQAIQDPYHRFLELMLRYSLFRNFVISVQENFGFVFKTYTELYADTFNDHGQLPELTFWRPTLSRWFIKMSRFHTECDKLFIHQVNCARQKQRIKYLQQCQSKQPQKYAKIYNNLIMNEKSHQRTEIGELLADQLDILLKQYSNYMVDLSIDEISVHYCGHSEHQVNIPFQHFQLKILTYCEQEIAQMIEKLQASHEILGEIYSGDVQFLTMEQYLKTRTIKKLVKQVEGVIGKGLLQIKNTTQFMEDMDQKLNYFNKKNMSILDIKDPYLRAFYRIVPQISVKDILSKSFQTANTTSISEQSQQPSLMYDSDEGESGQNYLMEVEEEEQFSNQIYEPPSSIFFQGNFYVQENSMMEEEESEDIQILYHQMQGGQTDLC